MFPMGRSVWGVVAAAFLLSLPANVGAVECQLQWALQAGGGFAPGAYPHGVAAADFNGDGRLDLVVANSNAMSLPGGTSSISIHRGNGDATFVAGATYAMPKAPYHVVARDFDGDGVIDLLVASYGRNVASFLRGLSSG